jgi:hypothetical protein
VAQEFDLPRENVRWLRKACGIGSCVSKKSSALWMVSILLVLLRVDLALVAMHLPLE